MAIVRCENHPVNLSLARNRYVRRVEPAGYPDSAAICGKIDCRQAGFLWLSEEEWQARQRGERFFEIHTQTAKIKASEKTRGLPA